VASGTRVYADLQMVDTIIRNLLSNALKFTQQKGTVTISATLQDTLLYVSVADSGIGIPDNDIDRLFRIDARYKRTGTAGEQGTGLGLILCKELVKKNRGTIWVERGGQQGTTFTFSLPQLPAERPK